jgi:hypothetical protein
MNPIVKSALALAVVVLALGLFAYQNLAPAAQTAGSPAWGPAQQATVTGTEPGFTKGTMTLRISEIPSGAITWFDVPASCNIQTGSTLTYQISSDQHVRIVSPCAVDAAVP